VSPINSEYPPPRIVVCAHEGDWFEWEKDAAPGEGDCPFGDCDCTPILYVKAQTAPIPDQGIPGSRPLPATDMGD